MQVRAGLGREDRQADRLRAGAWDLKELRSYKVEPDYPGSNEGILMMVAR